MLIEADKGLMRRKGLFVPKSKILFFLLLVNFLSGCVSLDTPSVYSTQGGESNCVPGEALVTFRDDLSEKDVPKVFLEIVEAKKAKTFMRGKRVFVVSFDKKNPVLKMVERLRKNEKVEFVQPNYIYSSGGFE